MSVLVLRISCVTLNSIGRPWQSRQGSGSMLYCFSDKFSSRKGWRKYETVLSAMNNKLVVVTDLGSFKAYKLETNNQHSTPRLELIEEFSLVDAHGKMIDRLT